MRIQRGLPYGLTLVALLSLAFAGWTHSNPASAQDDANKNAAPNAVQQPPDAPHGMRMGGPATVAASGDFVYVLRGNTLWQLKSSDLSVANQKDLPAPGAAGAGQ